MKKAVDNGNKNQIENLKAILKDLGITTAEELDCALAEALDSMALGIMTDTIAVPANTA